MVRNPLFWLVSLIGVFLDQWTKQVILHRLALQESILLWPGVFHITFVTNTGAAFSLLQDAGSSLKWISLGVSGVLLLVGWFATDLHPWEKVGYGFILAGALGNGIDRFAYGYVIDFLDFRLIRFPIFNLADVWINLGLLCLLWVLIQQAGSIQKR